VKEFREEIVVVNNMGLNQKVTGASIAAGSGYIMIMRIEFQFLHPEGKQDKKRRVELFSADPKKRYDDPKVCATDLCWMRIDSETKFFDPKTSIQEITVKRPKAKEILVTAWHPTLTPTSDGRPDEYEKFETITEGKKKGVRLIFSNNDAAPGKTIVTILPRCEATLPTSQPCDRNRSVPGPGDLESLP
jgi:hypothetical protein